MHTICAQTALLPDGWARDVVLRTDERGRIQSVKTDTPSQAGRGRILLAAPVNVHSHAFQRAMAGLTEARGPDPRDSFWTWRRLMYRFLDRLNPEHVRNISAMVQMEMLEAGYAACAEFHYLHHQPDGTPYTSIAEMSDQICAAAAETGIGLCLLPVLYAQGGCDGRALEGGQRRFGNNTDRFAQLFEAAQKSVSAVSDDAACGVAPHSLRAVTPGQLSACLKIAPGAPVHMHLAEQEAEVAEVRAALGARPADWLVDNAAPDAGWCLIHCTQMTPGETVKLARTGAVAGLCPITESNLGDGIFDGPRWAGAGGALAVGSDSNIRISLSEELRTLEYSQRLRDKSRAVMATGALSTGRRLYDAICAGGAQAIMRPSGRIEQGYLADLVTLDADAVHLAGKTGDAIPDAWIFAGDDRLVRDVWSAGRPVVRDGRHIRADAIEARYLKTLSDLAGAL